MATPQFVVASDAYTQYPGGVLALKCSEWMGPARGTLTAATNADTVCGEAVADVQTVTSSIFSANVTAYSEADDTLVIDTDLIPFELVPYRVLLSYRIDGDWDPAGSVEQFRGATQFAHRGACDVGMHGDVLDPLEANVDFLLHKARLRDTFMYALLDFIRLEGGETLHVRAYNHADSNTVVLLDQLVFFPVVFAGEFADWHPGDFAFVGADSGSSVPDTADGMPEDGDDGGDDNGQFTRMPFPSFNESGVTGVGDEGGGDYQQKAGESTAEYMTRILPDDFWRVLNDEDDTEASLHAYSLHGPTWREGGWWTEDEFDRTVAADGWGVTPEGFGWIADGFNTVETTRAYYVDGDKGVIALDVPVTNPSFEAASVKLALGGGDGGAENSEPNGRNETARIEASPENNIVLEGRFTMVDNGSVWTDGPPGFGLGGHDMAAYVQGYLRSPWGEPILNQYAITVWRKYKMGNNAVGGFPVNGPAADVYTWVLEGPADIGQIWASGGVPIWPNALFEGDISAWFDWGAEVAFKLELRRYLIRAKVWDASGAEPGSWDYEDFRPMIHGDFSPTTRDYPYSGEDLTDIYNSTWRNLQPFVFAVSVPRTGGFNVEWSLLRVGSDDEGGTPGSMFAYAEQPDQVTATPEEVGTIEVPWGPQQVIYWGSRDWTTDDGFGDFLLDFATKVWVESGSSDLERADEKFWYFRSTRGGIVSMNWRSGDRMGQARRVLVGG